MPFEFIILLRPWVNRGGLGGQRNFSNSGRACYFYQNFSQKNWIFKNGIWRKIT